VSYVVGNILPWVTSSISGVGGSIGSGIGRLHDFVLSSSLLNYGLEGRVGVVIAVAA
jgi:hypothetical protein